MAARYVLAALAVVFLAAALWRLAREQFRLGPASRTWLMIAILFGAVSAWLFWSRVGDAVGALSSGESGMLHTSRLSS